jgi:SHS family lactate transporter-like MFS transporter
MQFAVQGAWGIIPAHLNELSPAAVRGTFPGVVYQLGNLLASINAPLQTGIAAHFNGAYDLALVAVAAPVAIIVVVLTAIGTEAKGVEFARVSA